MTAVLTQEQIEAAIAALPLQGQVMLRLLLLQYFDLRQEDLDFIAADRPDPRKQAGQQSATRIISRETIQGIADRAAQYQTSVRQKRERAWLQSECLRKRMTLHDAYRAAADRLFRTRFGFADEAVQELKQRAKTAIAKTAIRDLDRQWKTNDISEEDYQGRRLAVEYQATLRLLDRDRARLGIAVRDYDATGIVPLQDHEIAHIWGIPAGTLTGRKLKFLNQYLQHLLALMQKSGWPDVQAVTAPMDLWKETLTVLSRQPVRKSIADYDGLEGSEAALLEKLAAFAAGTMPEELESRFWGIITQAARSGTEYGMWTFSLFPLQRLLAILNDLDMQPDSVEQDLLRRITPVPKEAPALPAPESEAPAGERQLTEMETQILNIFKGEL